MLTFILYFILAILALRFLSAVCYFIGAIRSGEMIWRMIGQAEIELSNERYIR